MPKFATDNMAGVFLEEVFYLLSFTLAIFFALELIWPGMVTGYADTGMLLIFWLIIGMIILIFGDKKDV
jgi:hypothetical protein